MARFILKISFLFLGFLFSGILAGEENKSIDVLKKELEPQIAHLWDFSGIQGEQEKKLHAIAKYINENMISIYTNIDEIDKYVRTIEEKNEDPDTTWYWKILSAECDHSSLLSYIWRRDDDYFKIMEDLADNFDITNAAHKERFMQLADPIFFNLNKNQRKIKTLGLKFHEKSQGDNVFQMLIKSLFSNAFGGTKFHVGVWTKMPRSGDDAFGQNFDPKYYKEAKVEQEKKIIQWNKKWELIMLNILNAKTKEAMFECKKEMEEMAFTLIEITSFLPPQNDEAEKEVSELFFKKIYLPVTLKYFDLVSLSEDLNSLSSNIKNSKKALDNAEEHTSENMKFTDINNTWKILSNYIIDPNKEKSRGNRNSYLQDYSRRKAVELIRKYAD